MTKKYSGGAIALTLVGTMTAGSPGVDDTFTVNTAATGWPTLGAGAGNTAVCQIDDEKILLKAISGTTFTVAERGYDGTTAASHANDAAIKHVPDATSLQAFADHIEDTVDAHDASAISYAGGTGMAATTVEAAIDELATEKANAADVTTSLAAQDTAVFYTEHTWAIPYPAVASGAVDFIIPMKVTVVAGETKEIESVSYQIYGGTSVTFSLCKSGSFTTTTAAAGYSGLVATTSSTGTDAANVALAHADYIRPNITAVSGTPLNLMVTVVIKHTVTLA